MDGAVDISFHESSVQGHHFVRSGLVVLYGLLVGEESILRRIGC